MKVLLIKCLAFCLAGLASTAQATLLVYEPFDYLAKTNLNNQGGGTGFAAGSNWITSFSTPSGSGYVCVQPAHVLSGVRFDTLATPTTNPFTATYTHLPSSGNYVGTSDGASGTALGTDHIFMYRKLETNVTATFTNGNTTWFSFATARAFNANARAPSFAIGAGILDRIPGDRGDSVTFGPGNTSKEAIAVGADTVNAGQVAGNYPGASINGVAANIANVGLFFAQYWTSAGTRARSGAVGGAAVSSVNGTGPKPGDHGYWMQGGGGLGNPVGGLGVGSLLYGYSSYNSNSLSTVVNGLGNNASHVNIVVAKIQWGAGAGGTDVISYYVYHDLDPLSESDFVTGSLSWTNATPSTGTNFNWLSLGGGRYFADELRIGENFNDVIGVVAPPEFYLSVQVANLGTIDAIATITITNTVAGKNYRVQYTDLMPPDWSDLSHATPATGTTKTVVDEGVAVISQRFYRAKLLP